MPRINARARMSVAARNLGPILPATADAVTDRRRLILSAWLIALAALAAYGFWAAWPFLRMEFRRLEPWQLVAVCCGDLIAALWFVRFAATHLVLGRPLVDEPAGAHARRAVTLFLVSMVGGLALDVGVTVYLRHVEHLRYAASPIVIADVSHLRTSHASLGRNYLLDCTWRHPDTGQIHQVTLRVHAAVAGRAEALARIYEFPPGMPDDVVRALTDERAPARVPIRYDPRWPARSWLEGVPEDSNGLFYASLVVHILQAVAALLIALAAWNEAVGRGGSGRLPWWLELSQAVPTAAQVCAVAFLGTFYRVLG